MHVSITVVGGIHQGRVIPIIGSEFRIGRDPSNHLRPASEDVSREHCAIIIRPDGKVFLRDIGSRNGTILNRRTLVHGEMQLENGDQIEVGPLAFRINLTAEPLEAAVATVTEAAESALTVAEDIHEEQDILYALREFHEPTAQDTVQVSKPNLGQPAPKPKDAGPKLATD